MPLERGGAGSAGDACRAAGDGAAVATGSRITGADSPVMADSSTEAMPSITVPSQGARSQTTSQARASLYILSVSSALVALGFIGQASQIGTTFVTDCKIGTR
jgi:hypothetical protein